MITNILIVAIILWAMYSAWIAYGMRYHIHPVFTFVLAFVSPITLTIDEIIRWIKK